MEEKYSKDVWLQALTIQWRVIYALILRETKTLYGNSQLGYGMVLLQTFSMMVVLWLMHGMMHTRPFAGLSVPLFYLSGYIVLMPWMSTVTKSMTAVKGNKPLLYFSRVQAIDIYLARGILNLATYFTVLIIYILMLYCINFKVTIVSPAPIIIAMLLSTLLGLGIGMIFAGIKRYYEGFEGFVSNFTRIMFFTSGVFFVTANLHQDIQKYLLYNPLVHLVDYGRSSFSSSYPIDHVNLTYPIEATIIVLFLGLLSERFTCHKDDV